MKMTDMDSLPQKGNDVPPGHNPAAVNVVREAIGLSRFYMSQRLGVTASELSDCENAARWPRSKNARQRLIAIANENKIDIGQSKEEDNPEESSLF